MDNSTIAVVDEDGGQVELSILEETRFAGAMYILVTDAPEDEDGECYVMKDTSDPEDPQAVYTFVEDEQELETLFAIFTELMEDTDTELRR